MSQSKHDLQIYDSQWYFPAINHGFLRQHLSMAFIAWKMGTYGRQTFYFVVLELLLLIGRHTKSVDGLPPVKCRYPFCGPDEYRFQIDVNAIDLPANQVMNPAFETGDLAKSFSQCKVAGFNL